MPASNETVQQRPLSGAELREIILKDVANILSKDGMFSPHIGYGRAAYSITVKLHIDNPAYPEHKTMVRSRNAARNEPDPNIRSIEQAPLTDPSDTSMVAAVIRERELDSPNHARIEHELPITIERRDPNSGLLVPEQVLYDNKDLEPGPYKDTDISDKIEAEWGDF